MLGTVRTFKEETRALIEQEMERVVKGVCESASASYEFTYTRGYPTLINHEEETEFVAELAKKVPSVTAVKEIEPVMGGEDYAYYLQHVKGTFFFTGARNPEWEVSYPHHHPKFDIDERALLIAAKTLGLATLEYMQVHAKEVQVK